MADSSIEFTWKDGHVFEEYDSVGRVERYIEYSGDWTFARYLNRKNKCGYHLTCFECGSVRHLSQECPYTSNEDGSSEYMDGIIKVEVSRMRLSVP